MAPSLVVKTSPLYEFVQQFLQCSTREEEEELIEEYVIYIKQQLQQVMENQTAVGNSSTTSSSSSSNNLLNHSFSALDTTLHQPLYNTSSANAGSSLKNFLLNTTSSIFQNTQNLLSSVPINFSMNNFLTSIRSITMDQKKLIAEYFLYILVIHSLGYDTSFAYIYAIKLCSLCNSDTNLLQKRIAYLIMSQCIPDLSNTQQHHSLLYLTVSVIQKDLQSTNVMIVNMALTALNRLLDHLGKDLIPVFRDVLYQLWDHYSTNTYKNHLIRKKVVLVLEKCNQLSSEIIISNEMILKILCDSNPSVMNTALQSIYNHYNFYQQYKYEFIPILVSILKQFVEYNAPPSSIAHTNPNHLDHYSYQQLTAPWIQVKLFQLLAFMGRDDKESSENMYEICKDALKKYGNIAIHYNNNAVMMLLYECIKTITIIYPSNVLITQASQYISSIFLNSNQMNYKYIGITLLCDIVLIDYHYALQYQHNIMQCLVVSNENNDFEMKFQILLLLGNMCYSHNVTYIVPRLVKELSLIHFYYLLNHNTHTVQVLFVKTYELIEKFAPNKKWYLQHMITLLSCPIYQHLDHIQSYDQMVLRMIAEGNGEADDEAFRTECVDYFYKWLTQNKQHQNTTILQMACWILGEYGYLLAHQQMDTKIMNAFFECLEGLHSNLEEAQNDQIKCWLLSAIGKVYARCYSQLSSTMIKLLKEYGLLYLTSRNVQLQQRCFELLNLIELDRKTLSEHILPMDGSCEEVDVDMDLSFLNSFVQMEFKSSVIHKSIPITTFDELQQRASSNNSPMATLKWKQYQSPVTNNSSSMHSNSNISSPMKHQQQQPDMEEVLLYSNRVSSKWNEEGYVVPANNSSQLNDIVPIVDAMPLLDTHLSKIAQSVSIEPSPMLMTTTTTTTGYNPPSAQVRQVNQKNLKSKDKELMNLFKTMSMNQQPQPHIPSSIPSNLSAPVLQQQQPSKSFVSTPIVQSQPVNQPLISQQPIIPQQPVVKEQPKIKEVDLLDFLFDSTTVAAPTILPVVANLSSTKKKGKKSLDSVLKKHELNTKQWNSWIEVSKEWRVVKWYQQSCMYIMLELQQASNLDTNSLELPSTVQYKLYYDKEVIQWNNNSFTVIHNTSKLYPLPLILIKCKECKTSFTIPWKLTNQVYTMSINELDYMNASIVNNTITNATEFGKYWKQYATNEFKIQKECSIDKWNNFQQLMDQLLKKHFYIIQVIGVEAIGVAFPYQKCTQLLHIQHVPSSSLLVDTNLNVQITVRVIENPFTSKQQWQEFWNQVKL